MTKLFGTDGVRGLAGESLNATIAMRLAMAAGIYFKKNSVTNTILVGKDTRRSGYMIETAIVAGLSAIGYDVRQVGPMPTPAVAFLTEDMRCDAGIMISASHNPFYDNGIKFFDENGDKLNLKAEKKIEEIFENENLIAKSAATHMQIGAAKRIDDVIGRYIVHIKNCFPRHLTLKGMRIVIDVSNGAAYKVAPTIFSELGAELIVLNDEPNGANINENCGALHPAGLCEQVKHLRADIGFAFDGDADRLVVVDEKGSVVDGDALLGVLAVHLQEQKMLKSNEIVTTLMSNQALDDFLKNYGIKLHRSAVGDKNVLEMMKEKGINFGGEQSGHIVFSDFAKTGDGLVSALQASACLLHSGKKASEIFAQIKPYPQILVNLSVNKKPPLEKIKGLKELEDELKQLGIRTLFRYSGTENLLRLLLEGKDESLVKTKIKQVQEFFQKELK